jgi:hypothetical protein
MAAERRPEENNRVGMSATAGFAPVAGELPSCPHKLTILAWDKVSAQARPRYMSMAPT